jgi:hypothetical protein
MPATFTFLHTIFLLWTSFLHWGSSVPLKRADSCPGYKASNVQRSASSLTADLTLAGTECNIHGQDLKDLKFSAQWQTGTFRSVSQICQRNVGHDLIREKQYSRHLSAVPAPIHRRVCSITQTYR